MHLCYMSYKVWIICLSLNMRTLITKRKRNTDFNLSVLFPQLSHMWWLCMPFFVSYTCMMGQDGRLVMFFFLHLVVMGPLLNGCSTNVYYPQAFCLLRFYQYTTQCTCETFKMYECNSMFLLVDKKQILVKFM